MRTIFLTAILFHSLPAFSEASKITATVSEQQKDNQVLYKVTVSSVGENQRALMVNFGESCALGKQIDHERYKFDLLPITNDNGNFKPNIIAPRDNFSVDTDNYLRLSSIEATSGNEKLPFVDQNTSKEIQFYTIKKNSNLMLDLPLCIQVVGGQKDEVEAIVSEERWVESDDGFDIEASIKACKDAFPGVVVDPNDGSHAAKCKDPKYQYLAALPSLQFSCVLEKRLQYRLSNIEKNLVLKAAKERATAQPTNLKLQEAYNKKLENMRNTLNNSISTQRKEIERLKARSEKILVSVNKACKG